MVKNSSINSTIGLNLQEVTESKLKWGDNRLMAIKIVTFWDRFKKNLQDPMIIILLVALTITIFFAYFGYTSIYEGIGIFFAIAIATLVSTFTEHKSEDSFRKLQEEASKIICKVFRDGKVTNIFITDIVRKDSILLQAGDVIPADGIVIKGKAKVNQAPLNGESKLAKKEIKNFGTGYLALNKVFRGSILVEGELVMEVQAVGDKSEYGKLSKELSQDSRIAPLKVALSKLADSIALFAYISSVLIALVFFGFSFDYSFTTLLENWNTDYMIVVLKAIQAITLAIMIIIMAVPEGLPMMIAMVLSLNMRKLIHDNVLVRKLTGIEAAGSLNILFSDKTGTITKGELEVVKFISAQNEYQRFSNIPSPISAYLLKTIMVGSSSEIVYDKDKNIQIIGGNQTDQALSTYISKSIKDFTPLITKTKIPFDSRWKFSANSIEAESKITLIKGGAEVILANCDEYIDEFGKRKKIDKEAIEKKMDDLAKQSMRVIAFAIWDEDVSDLEEDETPTLAKNLKFVGMVAIRDDIRPEAIKAIKECQKAGISIVMVTGDNIQTAKAIAKDVGILKSKEEVILTSNDLKHLSDKQLKEILPNLKVIARAKPTDKSRLVKIAQELNLVVGMTGDGVNDAPALKMADVGFAMGSGTELAKEAADIVILDNNFNSIEKAVLYGRTIFNSIQKFITYQLTVNLTAIIIVLFAPFMGYEMPFSLIQILWINLIMDTLAALALGGEPPLKTYMQEKPKIRGTHPISRYMIWEILLSTLFIIAIAFTFMLNPTIKEWFKEEIFLTAFFSFFIFINTFNAFNVRSKGVNIFEYIFKNALFLPVITLILTFQILIVTFGGEFFKTQPLNINEWLIITLLALLIIPYNIGIKIVKKYVD